MAEMHIKGDLRLALETQGVGLDADWKALGGIVEAAMLAFQPGVLMLSGRRDVLEMRVEVREEVKRSHAGFGPYQGDYMLGGPEQVARYEERVRALEVRRDVPPPDALGPYPGEVDELIDAARTLQALHHALP